MKTRDQIKNEIAKECGYPEWDWLAISGVSNSIVDEICERFATELIKETIEIADAHSESGCFDKEGALANALKLVQ